MYHWNHQDLWLPISELHSQTHAQREKNAFGHCADVSLDSQHFKAHMTIEDKKLTLNIFHMLMQNYSFTSKIL